MKTKKYIILKTLCLALVGTIFFFACSDDEDEAALSRLFQPVLTKNLSAKANAIMISIANLKGTESYTIEVSKDTFKTVDVTVESDTSLVVIGDLLWNQAYQVRATAHASDPSHDSKVSNLGSVTTEKFPTILKTPTGNDAIDVAVRVSWTTDGAPVTALKVFKKIGNVFLKDVSLTAGDITAAEKIVDGLAPLTTYVIYLYSGTAVRGWLDYTTKAPFLTGNIIDLRNIVGKPSILFDTLADVPSGSIIVLKRGAIYTIAAQYAFDKSLTIVSGLDFSGGPATLKMSSNFTLATSGTIDSIVFKDIIFKGSRVSNTSYDNDYILNTNTASASVTVNKFKLDGCVVKILRGTARLQFGGTGGTINNYSVNNCVFDSIRDFGIVTAVTVNKFVKISITNSTIYKIRKFINHAVTGNTSISIKNCTFNEAHSNSGATTGTTYLMDLNTVNTNITIDNCIFGQTWSEGGTMVFGGYRLGGTGTLVVTNSYSTSDFVLAVNPFLSLTSYGGTSATVFTDPAKGNFKIKDNNFTGKSAGDPRWQQ